MLWMTSCHVPLSRVLQRGEICTTRGRALAWSFFQAHRWRCALIEAPSPQNKFDCWETSPALKPSEKKKNLMSDSSINIAAAMPSNLRSSGGLFHLPRRLPTFFLGFHWPTTGCSPPPQTRAAASEKGCVCDWRQIWKPSGLSKHVVGHFSFVVVLIPAFDILLRPAGHQTLWGLGGGVQVARSASQLAARSDVELVLAWLEQSSVILYAYEVFYLLSERNGWDPTKNKNVCHLEHI